MKRTAPPFLNVSDAGVPVGLATYEERFSIPAEEQNAGRVVDYFYRMEFHITPRFFSDSNYLFFFFFLMFFWVNFLLFCGRVIMFLEFNGYILSEFVTGITI